jgi:hypothetical protein
MIDPASLAVYRQTAQTRQQAQRAAIEARRQKAWQVARSAAALLRHDSTPILILTWLPGGWMSVFISALWVFCRDLTHSLAWI